VAPLVRRNPPKLQSSFAKATEDTRIPPRPGGRGFLRRRVKIQDRQDVENYPDRKGTVLGRNDIVLSIQSKMMN